MLLPLVLIFSLAADGASANKDAVVNEIVVERIVAVVNGDIVVLSEVEGILDALLAAEPPPPGTDVATWRVSKRKEVLDTLVAEKLLDQEIKKLRIEVTEPEVDRVVEGTMQQYKLDRPRLEQALAQQGLSYDEYRDGLKKQLLKAKIIQLKVKNRVNVTDQDVKSTYAKQQRTTAAEVRIRARHMLFLVSNDDEELPSRARAEKAMARVIKGEEFSAVARDASDGPTRANGGALGEFGRGEMMAEFEDAAFKATTGKVMGPVRTPVGWHVILVDERVALETQSLADVETDLRNQLYEVEVEHAFRRYLDELKQNAYIDLRDEIVSR